MEDPPVGTRKLSRAFRAVHFQALATGDGWQGTARRRLEWAAALLAHNLLLRAGEIGHPQEREFDGTRVRLNLGLHTMDAADGGERRPRVGVGTCDGDQGRAGAGQADADAGQAPPAGGGDAARTRSARTTRSG
eukprot:896281-Pleurochrysis_carterae.AAC.1